MTDEETQTKIFYDMRMMLSVGSAIVSAVIAVLMVLHTLGILTYETRLSVIEVKMDEIYRSLSRIDHNVDDISKTIFKRN